MHSSDLDDALAQGDRKPSPCLPSSYMPRKYECAGTRPRAEAEAPEKPKGRLSRKARLAAKKAAKAARRLESDDEDARPDAAGEPLHDSLTSDVPPALQRTRYCFVSSGSTGGLAGWLQANSR